MLSSDLLIGHYFRSTSQATYLVASIEVLSWVSLNFYVAHDYYESSMVGLVAQIINTLDP